MSSSSRSALPLQTVNWGILGCGDVTEVKSGPALQKADGSALVAVMRRNGGLAADYARRHSVARWYDHAGSLVADPGVNAIYVATPPGVHLEGALLAARAGKPAYVEKPMARHATECVAMVAAFREAGVPLFVAYYRRALPRFVQVKTWLDDGAIGPLTGVYYRYAAPTHPAALSEPALQWRVDARNAGGGLFLDLGSHTLDLLDHLVGPLADVVGQAANLATPVRVEDTVAMTFAVRAGVPGVASWNFASAHREDLIELHGTGGRIVCSTFGNEPVRLERNGAVEAVSLPNPAHVHQPLVQTVVDALRGRGECPSTGESALRTSVVMDQVLSRYYGGRDDAFWERPETWPGYRPNRRGVPASP